MTDTAISLYEAKSNRDFQVDALPNLRLLHSLGLRVGTKVTVQSRYALGGPVLLRVEGAFSVAVGKDIATQISVKEPDAS